MEQPTPKILPPLDWSKWLGRLNKAISVAFVALLIGLLIDPERVAFSYLVGFMFCLSIGLGGFFLVLIHHLVDASWSVPIRRICEHLACLLRWMALAWVPIGFAAPKLFSWMSKNPMTDHALHAKLPLFTTPGFYLSSLVCFVIWWTFPPMLRKWSLEQDKTGAAECTHKMRRLTYIGIFLFAISLTLASIMWMKGLEHAWFSTMFGVYYFAGSVWTTIATVYMIVMLLQRQGILKDVITGNQYYYLGTLFFAFTVFYSYIHFSQYFIIWNGNIPEETFWYAKREVGTWYGICMLLIFGHFFIPFLALIRIDLKLNFAWMRWVCGGAWFMHFIDMSFNILPVVSPDGYPAPILDLAAVVLIGGLLTRIFIKDFNSHPPYPQRDPRMAECQGVYVQPLSESDSGATEGAK